MEAKIKRYFEIKEEQAVLKAESDNIRSEIETLFGAAKVELTFGDEKVRIQTKTRGNKRCDWAAFKTVNAELYGELVTESTSSYVDIRKVVNR